MSIHRSSTSVHPIALALDCYVRCLFEPEDIVEQRSLPAASQEWYPAADLPVRAARLSQANYGGQNIYAGVNPRRRQGGGTGQDVLLARSLFADWDGLSIEQVQQVIGRARLPDPTVLIFSGHGVHAYWRLIDPLHNLSQWTELQKRLIATVASDPAV